MQHLQSFPPDLNQSRKLQVSKLFYSSSSLPSINNRSRSVQFIPFFQQRDNMGKLLSNSSSRHRQSQFIDMMAQSRLFGQYTEQKQEQLSQSRINKVVQSFFKKNDMQTRQLARAKFAPKKLVIINQGQIKSPIQYTNALYDTSSGLNLVKTKKKNCIIRPQVKTHSPSKFSQRLSMNIQHNTQLNSQIKQQTTKLLRTQSMAQRKINQISQATKSPKKLFDHEPFKRSQNLLNSLKVKLNPQQLDYKRYKQQQQRSLKVFQDYEQGHEKFKQKMKKSKLIAYNIRKQLQID